MDAPTCRICGEKHWSRVCDGDDAVTKRVTPSRPVTVPVTPDDPAWKPSAQAQIDALVAEVAMLKRELAEARGGKPRPLTAAERMKKMREAKRRGA